MNIVGRAIACPIQTLYVIVRMAMRVSVSYHVLLGVTTLFIHDRQLHLSKQH